MSATRVVSQTTQHGAPGKPERTVCVPIPKHAVGWIVGKGGAKIKELKANSGALIVVNQGDDVLASVTISGSAAAVVLGEQLVNQELQKVRQREQRGL